ncbi:MAG: 4Fe-4S binding protein [Desulfobacteraceae bacterium]
MSTISTSDSKFQWREIDYDHCKGCGICARECPRGAIVMEKENV